MPTAPQSSPPPPLAPGVAPTPGYCARVPSPFRAALATAGWVGRREIVPAAPVLAPAESSDFLNGPVERAFRRGRLVRADWIGVASGFSRRNMAALTW